MAAKKKTSKKTAKKTAKKVSKKVGRRGASSARAARSSGT